ncbi:hypothetical protein RND81_04G065400 [Saponaria officinalis]|uniref:Aspartate/glutamate/uridylate kinase domain-containing protein n=1 Tax=Saponaria officinalis TaxID=3572 RepID=A0AAW1LH07_SAPOF
MTKDGDIREKFKPPPSNLLPICQTKVKYFQNREDISLLHGICIRFVIVSSTHVHIDKLLAERGSKIQYIGPYRISDSDSLEATMEAGGRIRIMKESKLTAGPSLCNIRRHGDNSRHSVSGNFVAAKRRGVVKDIAHGATGDVKKVDVAQVRERLGAGSIVLVSNLGYSSSGEVLNCNTYEVATAYALALGVEKLICIIDSPILDDSKRLILCLNLRDADILIRQRAKQSEIAVKYVEVVSQEDLKSQELYQFTDTTPALWNGRSNATFQIGLGFDNGNGLWFGEQGYSIGGQQRLSRLNGYPSELGAAAFVCRGGIQRDHLLDGTICVRHDVVYYLSDEMIIGFRKDGDISVQRRMVGVKAYNCNVQTQSVDVAPDNPIFYSPPTAFGTKFSVSWLHRMLIMLNNDPLYKSTITGINVSVFEQTMFFDSSTLEDKGYFERVGDDTALALQRITSIVNYVVNHFTTSCHIPIVMPLIVLIFDPGRLNIKFWVVILKDSPKVDISMKFVTIWIFDPGGNDVPLIGETWDIWCVFCEEVMSTTMSKFLLRFSLKHTHAITITMILFLSLIQVEVLIPSFYFLTPFYEAICDP